MELPQGGPKSIDPHGPGCGESSCSHYELSVQKKLGVANILIDLPWDSHRVMRVYGIALEMVGESPQKELINDTVAVQNIRRCSTRVDSYQPCCIAKSY